MKPKRKKLRKQQQLIRLLILLAPELKSLMKRPS